MGDPRSHALLWPPAGASVPFSPPALGGSVEGGDAAVLLQPVEQRAEAGGGDPDAGVRLPVVHAERVAVGEQGGTAREHDVVDVAHPFGEVARPEHPRVAAQQAAVRVVQVEEREAVAVQDAAAGRLDAVVDEEPALGRADGRGGQADLAGVPPRATPRGEDGAAVAEVPQVLAEAQVDVGGVAGDGAVQGRPALLEAYGEDGGVLVFGREDQTAPVEGSRSRSSWRAITDCP